MTAAVYRPTDAEYWVANWSSVLFAGDLFAAIPFINQPSETLSDEAGQGKHLLAPIAFGYGLLVSPTCDMVDQKTLEIAHPYRVFVPVVPLLMVAEAAPGARGNIGLIRSRDSVLPYMYLPPLPDVLDEAQDEERFAVADGARRPYDIDPATFPEDVPVWRGSVSAD